MMAEIKKKIYGEAWNIAEAISEQNRMQELEGPDAG